jgi:hypothetical protein
MSQPQINPDLFGNNSQTMFYIEGQTTAVLVTNTSGAREHREVKYSTPNLALAWCRKNRAGFVYMPSAPNN